MTTDRPLPLELDVDLAGLSAVAAQWSSQMPVSDQRIQSVPEGRTLRFYKSTGLLDRPLRYDGRVARYGLRHLLQLLAIRALQVEGQSLAQIQVALAGSTNEALTRIINAALGIKTFGIKTPGIKTPGIKTPGIKTPGIKTPGTETLGIKTPGTNALDTKASAPIAESAPGTVAPPETPPFLAAELAPGVVITIDSRVNTDPARVIALLRRALQGEET